jgi:SAM-dependent methyltransferase
VKGKIVSSLEAGVPVVTTTIGNEGIGLVSGESALIGDSADEIAAHVVRLLRDPDLATRLAEAGRRTVLERFGEETTRDALLSALGYTFCSVCGLRSPDEAGTTGLHAARGPCGRCGADAASTRLADVVVRPYRVSRASNLQEALRHLSKQRILGFAVRAPIRDLLASCPYFEDGASTAAPVGGIDLIVCGDATHDAVPVSAVLEEAVRSLRVGGRLVLVVADNGTAGGVTRAPVSSPSSIVSYLAAAGFRVYSDRRMDGRGEGRIAVEAVRDA